MTRLKLFLTTLLIAVAAGAACPAAAQAETDSIPTRIVDLNFGTGASVNVGKFDKVNVLFAYGLSVHINRNWAVVLQLKQSEKKNFKVHTFGPIEGYYAENPGSIIRSDITSNSYMAGVSFVHDLSPVNSIRGSVVAGYFSSDEYSSHSSVLYKQHGSNEVMRETVKFSSPKGAIISPSVTFKQYLHRLTPKSGYRFYFMAEASAVIPIASPMRKTVYRESAYDDDSDRHSPSGTGRTFKLGHYPVCFDFTIGIGVEFYLRRK